MANEPWLDYQQQPQPQAGAQPWNAYVTPQTEAAPGRVSGPWEDYAPAQAPTPPPAPVAAQPAPPPTETTPTETPPYVPQTGPEGWQFPRGLVAGTMGANPKMFGGAMEAVGTLTDSPTLVQAGQSTQQYGQQYLEANQPRVPTYRDIPAPSGGVLETLGRGAQYAGYSIGQGIGSTIPSVATGLTAAALTANPFVGLAVGAFGPSYAQNLGDVYTSAKEDPDIAKAMANGIITPKQVASASMLAAVPMAALDVGGLEAGYGLATGTILHELKIGLLKKMALGAFTEGGTEALQEVFSDITQKYLGSNKSASDYFHGVVDNFLGGALTGGAMTGAGHIVVGRPKEGAALTEEEKNNLVASLSAPPPATPVQPATPGAPPTEKPPTEAPLSTSPLSVPNPISGPAPIAPSPIDRPVPPSAPSSQMPAFRPDQIPEAIAMTRGQIATIEGLLSDPEKVAALAPGVILNYQTQVATMKKWLAEHETPEVSPNATPPIEGEILPPTKIPNHIVELLTPAPPEAQIKDVTPITNIQDLVKKSQEERKVSAGVTVDTARLMKILGKNLYGDLDNMPDTVVKELLQNSVDNIRPFIEQGIEKDGHIDIRTDPKSRTLTMVDNGTGMTPDVLTGKFLQIAGTQKESGRPGGGFGIAKMMTLFANHAIKVITMRDGQVTELNSTGPALEASAMEGGAKPQATVRSPTRADQALFPRGHGTLVQVTVPHEFQAADGTVRKITFRDKYLLPFSESLKRSPLFENINVSVEGKQLPIGSMFPANEYAPFLNFKFDWGNAKMYISKLDHQIGDYISNMHILSNGLWQFSREMSKDPTKQYGPKIQKTFWLDIQPKVKAEDIGYPFDLNRQQFTAEAQKDFGQIVGHIAALFHQSEVSLDVENFGEMQYISLDPKTGKVTNTGAFELKPPKPLVSAVTGIKMGDNIEVHNGQLIVKGKVLPEVTPDQMAGFKINYNDMKIPQDKISSQDITLHDNTAVSPTGGPLTDTSPRISMTQLGVQKFGQRFYEYVYLIGAQFRELRDIIAKYPEYGGLMKEAIGISFDKEYRGVSIRVPFSGSFLNPAAPRFVDAPKAAVGMITTMMHELAHHTHRAEDGLAPVIQEIFTRLRTDPKFNYNDFEARVIRAVGLYHDVLLYLNGVYDSGNVESRGRRFKTGAGSESREAPSDVGDPTRQQSIIGPKDGTNLSEWVALGPSAVANGVGYSDGRANVASTGVDASFGTDANQRALDRVGGPGVDAAARQPETQEVASRMEQAFKGNQPVEVKEMAAQADRFNWFYKWAAGLLDLISANPRFTPLLRYGENASGMHRVESRAQDAAVRITKDWRRLGAQSENLTAFLDDLANMVYRTPDEVKQGVVRQPTQAEVQALQQKHKMSQEAILVAGKIKRFMDMFLDIMSQNAIDDAVRLITDPVKVAKRIDEVRARVANLKNRPYFPFMRYGRHYVIVTDSAGNVIWHETFERHGFKGAESQQMRRYAEMVKQYGKDNVKYGILPEQVGPLIGMPRTMLEHIQSRLQLTPQQIGALEQLKFELSPSMSFRHRFQNETYAKGYSQDFMRAFSSFAFYGARYNARLQFAWKLEQNIRDAQAVGGNKADRIADYMRDHMQNTLMNAKGDHGIFKSAIFMWAMGYVPAAATQNLSQTPMITLPYLAAKYGDARATKAIVKAMASATSYYRRGTISQRAGSLTSDFEFKALNYGIQTGRISETQAAELAALSQSNNLAYGIGGSAVIRGWKFFMEKSALMFETAEQFNRRIAFRAALDLAMQDNNAKEVSEAVNRYSDEYQELLGRGFTVQQARSIIAANHTVEQTQFVYARYARPRFMRGSIPGTLFVFKRYIQAVVMLMAGNKKDVLPRYLLISMLLGGMGGIPGYDDIKDLVEAAWRWLGYNTDPETEVRRYIMQFSNGQVPPDIVLHGLARRGFGIPALLDYLGSYATGRPGRGLLTTKPGQNFPYPVLDRSKAITSGPLLPIEIGKLLQPQTNVDRTISQQTEKASGAVFSVGFNIYKAIMDQRAMSDPKRWEQAVPRALGGVSKAFRTFSEGRERGAGGVLGAPTITNYDPRDTEQLMEIIGLGLGYNNLRTSSAWDRIIAQQEHIAYIDFQRKGLMEQFNEARLGGQPQEIEAVRLSIQKFNHDVAGTEDRAKAITAQGLIQSMKMRSIDKVMKESGLSRVKGNIPINRAIQDLFPENTVDVRRR